MALRIKLDLDDRTTENLDLDGKTIKVTQDFDHKKLLGKAKIVKKGADYFAEIKLKKELTDEFEIKASVITNMATLKTNIASVSLTFKF